MQSVISDKNDEEENDLGDIFFSQKFESYVNAPLEKDTSVITLGRLESDEYFMGLIPKDKLKVAKFYVTEPDAQTSDRFTNLKDMKKMWQKKSKKKKALLTLDNSPDRSRNTKRQI